MPKSFPSDAQKLGFLRFRKNGNVDEINSSILNLFGYKSKKEFLSSNTPKEIFKLISKNLTYIENCADWTSFESIFSKKDGSNILTEYFISESDDFVKVHINGLGIQEGLERALRESEEKSKLTLDTLIDGVITMDTNYLIESVNPAVEKIFGYKSKELVGKNVKILMPEPDKGLHDGYVDSYLKSGKAKIIGVGRELKGLKKNGKVFPIYLGVNELNLHDRKLFIGLIRDISAQKKAEKNLLLFQGELENKVVIRTSELMATNEKLSREVSNRKATEIILERQAAFAEQNPGPVFRTDFNGTITFANPVSEKLYGKKILNKSIITLMKGITKSLLTKMKGGKAKLFEEIIDDKTFLLTIIKDTKTKNIFIYGADITFHRESEELLKVSEEKFRQFFYNQPEYCYVVSPEGIILDVNRAALKMLGYKRKELIGKSVLKVYPPESHDRVKHNLMEWQKTGILKEKEMEVITKNGERRIVYLTASAIHDKYGGLLHSISVQLDITDRIRNQEEKERLSRNLGYRVKELSCLQAVGVAIVEEISIDNLLAKISNIVLSGMRYPEKAWSKLLFDTDEYVSNASNINEESMIGSDIGITGDIRGVLQVGYIDSSKILDEEAEMCHNITHRIGLLIERNELREDLLKKEKLEAVQKLAAAVAHEFNQPLQSLQLISALASEGEVSAKSYSSRIPKEVSKISSLVNKLLNITAVETKAYAAGNEIIDLNISGSNKKTTENKVLIVDDEESILQLMSRIIERSGLKVDCALTGEEALKLVNENSYGLVISDISLPGISGVDLFRAVSKDYQGTAFIFMSGYAIDEIDESVINKSAGFLAKPFDIAQIMKTVNNIFTN